MGTPDNNFSELVGLVRSWLPWRSEPSNVSRDFWMPDQICRVCYECDVQFTLINRKHHCRLCGRVFCAKCTANSVPAPSSDSSTSREDWERIRVCNYCFKQWERGVVSSDKGVQNSSLDLSPLPSTASLTSSRSTVTVNSSTTSTALASHTSVHQQTHQGSFISLHQSSLMETEEDQQAVASSERSEDITAYSADQYRSDDDDDDDDDDYYYYRLYRSDSDSETRYFPQDNDCYGHDDFDTMSNGDESQKMPVNGEIAEGKSSASSPLQNSLKTQDVKQIQTLEKKVDELDTGDECGTSTSMYALHDVKAEPVDFENNGLLWIPPEPEDKNDEREHDLLDDDDEGDGMGEWRTMCASDSFGSGEYRNRERPIEEHKKVIKNVVDGHFRALVAQLLQVENVTVGEEGDREGWLEIITSLSWEAATLLKPDMSKSGGMDPGGYVKVKCIAAGRPCESTVVKGVVCKKNVAHRRMTSEKEKASLLILEGALEYQRVTNHLSSFDTLLQQEMDHLKMAVAKIDKHRPNILLVEKSVSRYAQDYLLAKNISLVLNIKRPLLERIARCTGAQIVPSVDHLATPTLGYCDRFHVDRILEGHGSAGQNGKKLVKTLMFFEGCPKPLGCTILLRGANGDELKKVKHVIQYGVFAAYHLALETSFLADEGASLPELPMSSPITVALPDKASSIVRSISTVPGFSLSTDGKAQGSQLGTEPLRSLSVPSSVLTSSVNSALVQTKEVAPFPSIPSGADSKTIQLEENLPNSTATISFDPSGQTADSCHVDDIVSKKSKEKKENVSKLSLEVNFPAATNHLFNSCGPLEATADNFSMDAMSKNFSVDISQQLHNSDGVLLSQGSKDQPEENALLKEEFPPSPADHQSILVSLSSRCVWKGTVCERSHLFRIKYYGNFDKPLGRFLRDHLFDQNFRCRSCDMPSEAHVHCYTHQQGTLTISVKRLSESLKGEKEGKIWMWHRCLRCPRSDGFPPATKRVVMSDAAWGLSFGKFLELSFSNHAAASRVASCGHSLHRDCLRFYGFGKMVACFRYASIDVHSVHLPPAMLDFNYDSQEWLQKEMEEVVNRAELLFSEVLNALVQISERPTMKTAESRRLIADLEEILQREKAEFEESLQNTLNKDLKIGRPAVDILDINRLRRQLIFQSYMWDHRLIHLASLDKNSNQNGLAGSISARDRSVSCDSKLTEINSPVDPSKGFNSYDNDLGDVDMNKSLSQDQEPYSINQSDALHQKVDLNLDINDGKESKVPSYQTSPLESGSSIRRALSEGQTPLVTNLSDTLDAAWTGENQSGTLLPASSLTDSSMDASSTAVSRVEGLNLEDHAEYRGGLKPTQSVAPKLLSKGSDNIEDSFGWLKMPFYSFYCSLNKNFLGSAQKFDALKEYKPVYISPFLETGLQGGARLLLPLGMNDTVLPVFDDEPTSIISYALMSPEYDAQVSDEGERSKDGSEVISPFMASDSLNSQSIRSSEDLVSDLQKSVSSVEGSHLSTSGSRGSGLDTLPYTKALHARVNFTDESPQGKVKYSVTCYYGKRFEALRKISCPSELDYIRSLSRCKKWGAQGGKSGVFFAKTLDDRFIIKQVTKTELESFLKFAPEYFKYVSESIRTCSPTCLAKILGIYQVTAKHAKGGKETKIDVLVMENLLFRRTVKRLYDLKGSSRSRYNPDPNGSNKVLLDQNLIEAMPTSPIFVGNKAKRLLDRAVWNDTSFLASIDVMDYSLLVGIDEEKHELVIGIIDFMRQYTWDKHLETWVKTSGILGGPKNASPTVISPMQYKKRFRKAMTTYFLMVPDQWSPLTILPSKTPEPCEENAQGEAVAE